MTVAPAFSIDRATRDNGGLLSHVTLPQLTSQGAFGRAVRIARPHVITGPVKGPSGFYVFEVVAGSIGMSP